MTSTVANAKYLLAICRELDDSGRLGKNGQLGYTSYFINNTNKSIDTMNISMGGFYTSDDDKVVQSVILEGIFDNLAAKDSLTIQYLNDDNFYSVFWYKFIIKTMGEEHKIQFTINKYRRGLIRINSMTSNTKIPVINKTGDVVLPHSGANNEHELAET